jgi:hypothetical protein
MIGIRDQTNGNWEGFLRILQPKLDCRKLTAELGAALDDVMGRLPESDTFG